MLVDSHCHLNMIDYGSLDTTLDAVIQNAMQEGVSHLLCVGTDLKDIPDITRIIEHYPQISGSVGLHPNEPIDIEPTVEQLIELANHPKLIAIGETGLDYYRSESDNVWQKERFIRHIAAAKALKKPLIIHTRQARADTIAILQAENAAEAGGVMHCFTEDWETAKSALDLNFYISFSGIVTFKNAVELQAVAKMVPLDRMLIETDAPFLAPVPFRGQINQPVYVKQVAEFLANLRGISFEALAKATTENFYELFFKSKVPQSSL